MNVWVTGASSGLGQYTAQALVRAGHTVIGGARSFRAGQRDGMHTLPLDVTDDASVAAFAQAALRIAPTVDALINAAGVLTLGPCEQTSVEEYRQVMDTDFLGMVRMNQQVLPLMRAQGRGRIVMFSSINGLLGIPFQSAYTAAKHAVEGYAECLQMELHRFGIEVCLVEPGDHRGGSQRCRRHAAAVTEQSPYARDYADATTIIDHDERHGSDPVRLGETVTRALARRHLPVRLRIASPDQHLAVYLHDLLTPGLNGLILRGYYLNPAKAAKYCADRPKK